MHLLYVYTLLPIEYELSIILHMELIRVTTKKKKWYLLLKIGILIYCYRIQLILYNFLIYSCNKNNILYKTIKNIFYKYKYK